MEKNTFSDADNRKKVLIIKLSSLGDVIFNVPLANVLKQNGYEVSWLVGEKGFDIVNDNPCVDKIFFAPIEKWKKSKNIFKNLKEACELLRQLRRENFDICLDTQMRLKSLFFTRFCNAKRRIISKDAKEFSKFGANEIIPSIRDENNSIVKNYLKYAQYLGLDVDNITVTLPQASKEVIQKVDELLQDVDRTKPLVVIAPATTWIGKHWDKNNWKVLISELEKEYTLIFTGTKNDNDLINYIGGDKHLNIAGKTSLKELIEVLRRADMVISLDSGTTHLAWATQNPKIVSIYCCTPKNLYAPVGDSNKYAAIASSICVPCHHKKCRAIEKYACTASPAPEIVLEKTHKLFSGENK